jgi:hypothetical protein
MLDLERLAVLIKLCGLERACVFLNWLKMVFILFEL